MLGPNPWLLSLVLALPIGLLTLVRKGDNDKRLTGALCTTLIGFWLLVGINALVFRFEMPMTTIAGMWVIIILELVLMAVIAIAVDSSITYSMNDSYSRSNVTGLQRLSVGSYVAIVALVGFLAFSTYVDNTDVWTAKDAKATAALVTAVNEPMSAIPDTNTDHMAIVPADVATQKASQELGSAPGNLNTYFNLGPATEEFVNGQMMWEFQLLFDGSGNKHRQHNTVPGYISVSAEDPNAPAVGHYGIDPTTHIDYQMHYCLNCGQGQDLERYIYAHYPTYLQDDPTLEIADNGAPYFSVTLLRPAMKWNYDVPVKLLLVNANTGAISEYGVGLHAKNPVPDWVDRVYSAQQAVNYMTWWGNYKYGQFCLAFGCTSANKFQVSGNPVLVYTNNGQASWRMLMTSYNSDTAVNYIVLFDTRTGLAQIYRPSHPMGIESNVYSAFNSTSNGNVKADHLTAEDLTLHSIYGHLTWVVTYENDSGAPSFQGMGLLNAYSTSGNDVAFGTTKAAALQAYLTELANSNGNNSAPASGSQTTTVTGVISAIQQDTEGGQSYYYVELVGDTSHAYRVMAGPASPAVIFARVGDHVTITFLNLNIQTSLRNVSSFTDTRVPLTPVG